MSTPSKTLAASALAFAAAALLCSGANAASIKPSKAKRAAKPAPALVEPEPDIAGSTSTDFHCELGNKITIYQNESDNEHIALRWQKQLHRLNRVDTTTGANRFENTNTGLVWIGIPSKGMLLDSKHSHQLANECMSAEQSKPLETAEQGAKKS
ncbi:MAG: hypothetical protein V4582_21745 [Pseudomonadota bacterium]